MAEQEGYAGNYGGDGTRPGSKSLTCVKSYKILNSVTAMAVNIDFHDYSNTNDPVWPKQEEVGLFLVLFNTYFAQSMKLDKFVDSGAMAYFYKGILGKSP